MTQALVTQNQAEVFEQVIIQGDLSKLTPQERVNYYRSVCESIGLNPLTKPFDYINLNGKLTLYAKKDATDQLRKVSGVSIGKPNIQFQDDLIIVSVSARDKTGREDSDIGVVKKGDMRGDVANALMKAVTKAKRRVTLSLCGLGWLDETEVETVPDARPVDVDSDSGVIITKKETRVDELRNQEQQPEQSKQSTPAAKCTIKTPEWAHMLEVLAEKTDYYNDKNGHINGYHVQNAAAKCGYSEATDDNIAHLLSDLYQYAIEQQTTPPQS